MVDLTLLLAADIPDPWLLAAITTTATGIGGSLKLVWTYWTKREANKAVRYKQVLDAKDLLAAKKDARIEELSKELSKKSDNHAKKIEELMNITLTKVEGWSEKQEQLLDRALSVQSEFAIEVREFAVEMRRINQG